MKTAHRLKSIRTHTNTNTECLNTERSAVTRNIFDREKYFEPSARIPNVVFQNFDNIKNMIEVYTAAQLVACLTFLARRQY